MCIISDKIISLSLPLSLVLCSQDSRYNRLRKTSVIKRKARKLTNGKFITRQVLYECFFFTLYYYHQ